MEFKFGHSSRTTNASVFGSMALVFYPRSFLSILVSLFLYYVKIDRTNKQHIIDKIKKELYIYIYIWKRIFVLDLKEFVL